MPQFCDCARRAVRWYATDVYFMLAEEFISYGGAELFNRLMPTISQRLTSMRQSAPYNGTAATAVNNDIQTLPNPTPGESLA